MMAFLILFIIRKTMNKLFNIFKLFYKYKSIISLFIIGLLFFLWTIYNRLFRYRESSDLNFELNYWKLFFYSYICILNITFLTLLILELLYRLKILKKKESYKETWYRRLGRAVLSFSRLMKNSLETFYNNTFRKPFHGFLDKCCYFVNDNQLLIAYGIPTLMFLSQYIVVLSLVIDVFYFNRFHYFYKTLILLIIPFLITIWMYCVKEYCNEGIEFFKTIVDIEVIDQNNLDFSYLWISQKYPYTEEAMRSLANAHLGLSEVLRVFFYTTHYKSVWIPALILHSVKTLLYIICWGYLILGMFFFH